MIHVGSLVEYKGFIWEVCGYTGMGTYNLWREVPNTDEDLPFKNLSYGEDSILPENLKEVRDERGTLREGTERDNTCE